MGCDFKRRCFRLNQAEDRDNHMPCLTREVLQHLKCKLCLGKETYMFIQHLHCILRAAITLQLIQLG